ncbi:MAG: HD domain-containing protein [Chloroflexi bacterium]|nr:HD domain-containing protein [Chloroflexota bacterium]
MSSISRFGEYTVITIAKAKRYYERADAVHDFDHVLRVLALAERIGRAEGANLTIVRAAALLHDAGRDQAETDGFDHAAFAADQAHTILAEQPPEKVKAVAHAIAAHRFRTGPAPSTLEAQVLFDADKLDAIGAVGVARAFAYGGAHGQRLWTPIETVDMDRWLEEGDNPRDHTPVHEFVVKLSRLKERLFTLTGQSIAEERHAYMVAFFQRFDAEARGIQ